MKKRRWILSQMGVPSFHDSVESAVAEMKEADKTARHGDKFSVRIVDATDEEIAILKTKCFRGDWREAVEAYIDLLGKEGS
jgi:CTP-dependent riboflavin kinase